MIPAGYAVSPASLCGISLRVCADIGDGTGKMAADTDCEIERSLCFGCEQKL